MVERLNLDLDVRLRTQQLDKDAREILRRARALDRAFGAISPRGVSGVGKELRRAGNATKLLERNTRSATSSVNNLGRQAELTARRFIVYNVIAGFFFRLAGAIREGVGAFIQFDKQLNAARQILNPLLTDIDAFTEAIFALGKEFGVAIGEVQEAQEIFIRQGKTQQEVIELTRQSLALAASAGIEFAQATEAITAAINQFAQEGLTAVEVADKFTAVSIRNAVTAQDLDLAIRRAGAAAATVGVEFDNLIGFITAAQEATRRGGQVIGTGLRTIFTRIFRAPSIAAMEELGIETRKTTGEFRDADDLLRSLAQRFTTLNQTQRISIASTIAGQRQIATLLAVLANFEKATEATTDAIFSQGEAARLTRIRQEALAVQLQKVVNEFLRFGVAIGNLVSEDVIGFVDGLSKVFGFLGDQVESSGSFFAGPFLSTLTKVGTLLLLQTVGVGKLGAGIKGLGVRFRETRQQIATFNVEQERAGRTGVGRLGATSAALLGPTKELQTRLAINETRKAESALAATTAQISGQEAINANIIAKTKSAQSAAERAINLLKEQQTNLSKEQTALEEIAANNIGARAAKQQLLNRLETEIEGTKNRIRAIDAQITTLGTAQQASVQKTTTLAKQRVVQEQAVAKAIQAQQAAQEAQNRSILRRGAGGGVGAIGLLLGFNLLSEAAGEFFDESEKSTKALQVGLQEAGGIASTLFLVGLGPLGLLIAGVQAIIATTRILRAVTGDWGEEVEKVEDAMDKVANVTRASKSLFEEVRRTVASIKLEGISDRTLSEINDEVEKFRKTFEDIPTDQLAPLEGQLRRAFKTGNLQAIREVQEAAETLAGQEIIRENQIDREVLLRAQNIRNEILTIQKILNDPVQTGLFGGEQISALVADLTDAREEFQELEQEVEGVRGSLVRGFIQAARSTESFNQALLRLDFREQAEVTGILGDITLQFLRAKKNFDILANSADELAIALEKDEEAFNLVNNRLDISVSQFDGVQRALRETAELADKNVTEFFRLAEAVDTQSKEFKDLTAILAANAGGGAQASIEAIEKLSQSLVDGTRPIRVFRQENNELAILLDGLPPITAANGQAYVILSDILRRTGRFTGLLTQEQDTLGEIQLSNARITELLGRRYEILANQIRRTVETLSGGSTAFTNAINLNQGLIESFPSRALESNRQVLQNLLNQATALGPGFQTAIKAFRDLEIAGEDAILNLTTIVESGFLRGGGAGEDIAKQIEIGTNGVQRFAEQLEALERNLSAAGQTKGLSGIARETADLAREAVALSQLSSAVLGLDALERQIATGEGQILDSVIDQIFELQGVLSKGFQFGGDGEGIRIDEAIFDEGGRAELASRINTFLTNLQKETTDRGERAFRLAGQKLITAIIEGTNRPVRARGDALQQRLETLLTQSGQVVSEGLRKALDELRDAFIELDSTSQEVLNNIVETTNVQLGNLATIIQQGFIPPETTLTEILVGEFEVASRAADAAIIRTQNRLTELTTELQTAREREEQVRADVTAGRAAAAALESQTATVLRLEGEITAAQAELFEGEKRRQALAGNFNKVVNTSITQLNTSLEQVFKTQQDVAKSEFELFQARQSFIDTEGQALGARLALLQQERDIFEEIQARVAGLEEGADLGSLANEIARLTEESVAVGFNNAAQAEAIRGRITELRNQLNLQKTVAEFRIESLNEELDIIREQREEIESLGLEFAKANQKQQASIIEAARLTEQFFGGLQAGDVDSTAVRDSIVSFLRSSTDQTRNLVISQLERLEGAGGTVGGVSARDILQQIGASIGDALFRSPEIAIAERQEQIQRDILREQENANRLAELDLRIAATTATAQARIAESITARGAQAGIVGEGAIDEVERLSEAADENARAATNLLRTRQRERDELARQTQVAGQAAVTNERLVDTFQGIDLSAATAEESLDEFRSRMVELRDALLTAEDDVIDAQGGVTSALSEVSQALVDSTKAQGDFTLALREAERTNIQLTGGFATFVDELNFLRDAFGEQIIALRSVGAAEEEIADLRVRLAEQELGVFERLISDVERRAESALTAAPGEIARQQEFAAAGTFLADIFRQFGITPGGAAPGRETQDELARVILNLPQRIRENIAGAFENLPPGRTFGGFSAEELRQLTLSSIGGGGDGTPDLIALQEEAAQRREIIAENSTAQLQQSRSQTFAAFENLRAAQETLQEAIANRDLARLQLDETRDGFSETTSIMGVVADNINRGNEVLGTVARFNEVQSGTLEEIRNNQLAILDAERNRAQARQSAGFSSAFDAAGGTLTAAEMAGLLNAGQREKRAMPPGAGLGVFNTSETVLTRRQARMMRRSTNIPNAVDGFGNTSPDNERVIELLQAINTRLGAVSRDDGTRTVNLQVDSQRNLNVTGLAGIQTALQDIISDRTGELFTREEGLAVEQFLVSVVESLRNNQGMFIDASLGR
jgi:TP901 family phage tail tape measure protein